MTDSAPSYYPGFYTVAKVVWSALSWLCFRREVTLPEDAVPMLLVLDPIEAYASLASQKTIEALQDAIVWARTCGYPVAVTRWTRSHDHADERVPDAIDRKGHWSFYVPASQTDILPQLELALDNDAHDSNVVVFETNKTNALSHTPIRDYIVDAEGCTHLIIVGSWLESCVINTTRAAVDSGMDVVILRPACYGHGGMTRWWSLFTLQHYYATVVDAIRVR